MVWGSRDGGAGPGWGASLRTPLPASFPVCREELRSLFQGRAKLPPVCRALAGLDGASQQALQRCCALRRTFARAPAAVRRRAACAQVQMQMVRGTPRAYPCGTLVPLRPPWNPAPLPWPWDPVPLPHCGTPHPSPGHGTPYPSPSCGSPCPLPQRGTQCTVSSLLDPSSCYGTPCVYPPSLPPWPFFWRFLPAVSEPQGTAAYPGPSLSDHSNPQAQLSPEQSEGL